MAARDQLKGISNPPNPVDPGFQVTLTNVAKQISIHLNQVPDDVQENFLKFGMGLVDKSDHIKITIIWQSQKDLPEKCRDVLNLWAVKRESKWENVIEQLRQIGLTGLADNLNNELDRSNQPTAPNITEKSTIPDMSNVKVKNLWTKDELKKIVEKEKKYVSLPEDKAGIVLQRVVVLLVAVNEREILATLTYLKPLDGYDNIFTYSKRVDSDGQQSEIAMYYIGTYGLCPTAVRVISQGSNAEDGASSAPKMARACFPSLGAIIGVGVACGVEKEVRMCDVLVSSKIVNYGKSKAQSDQFLRKGEDIEACFYLKSLFTKHLQWPNDSIKERLKRSNMHIPEVKSGVILSGPFVINDPALKERLIKSFDPDAIGIEMEGAYLFAAVKRVPFIRVIIVKAVSDFGDGDKNDDYQPTAALMAADRVNECLNDYQVEEMLKNKNSY